jgi:hypothetical protein
MFTAFGGSQNQAFVATWDPLGDNAFYALDAQTGAQIGLPFTNGGGVDGIGISSGGAAVDYAGNKVYFTSRQKSPGPGTPNTVWCMNITAGGLTLDWALALGDIDVGPVLRSGRLYVASLNTIYSIDVNAVPVPTYYSYALPALEDVKGFISTDRNSTRLYFATTTKIWGFDDAGAFTKLWPEVTLPGGGNMPSVALFTRGTPYIYVGGNDGKLYQLDVTSASVTLSPTLLSVPVVPPGVPAVVGSPSHDTLASPQLMYVGTDEGVIYAVEVPLP